MSDTFRALLIEKAENGQRATVQTLQASELMPGDTRVAVHYSTLNYKDGLAITGRAPVVRHWPMVPGIDFAGEVTHCESGRFAPGDRVLCNGWGMGEKHWGGCAELAQVPGEWLQPIPAALDSAAAMAIGTAGYTAMLCVLALEDQGVRPEHGPVVVTGATGGVGSIAVALLARRGFSVSAVSGKPDAAEYLLRLGANEVLAREALSAAAKPLEKETWAGAVDTVGSSTLAKVLAQTRYGGSVAACGLAQGADLPATVMPFILRGVRLIGVDSVMAPMPLRQRAWDTLAAELPTAVLEQITRDITLEEAPAAADALMAGAVSGRLRVRLR